MGFMGLICTLSASPTPENFLIYFFYILQNYMIVSKFTKTSLPPPSLTVVAGMAALTVVAHNS
jgi:hypothetical protein